MAVKELKLGDSVIVDSADIRGSIAGNALLRTLLETIPDLVYVKDREGRHIWVNEGFARVAGLPRDEFAGKTNEDLLAPDLARLCNASDAAVLESKTAGRYEEWSQESPVAYDTLKIPLLDQDGVAVGLIGISRDISEQQRALRTLEERNSLEQLFTQVSSRFINISAAEVGEVFRETLPLLGEFLDVDICDASFFEQGTSTVAANYMWYREGIPKFTPLSLDTNTYSWITRKLIKEGMVHIPKVSDLPDEAANERFLFTQCGIQSVIMVPIIAASRVIGYYSFEALNRTRDWSPPILRLLRTIGHVFGNAWHRKMSEESLTHRVDFEQLITSISTHFINLPPDNVDEEIGRALERLGRFTSADRAFITIFSPDLSDLLKNFEWCREGVAPQIDQAASVDAKRFPWAAERFGEGKTIVLNAIADLPPEAASERGQLILESVQSFVAVPVYINGRLRGYLGLAAVQKPIRWHADTDTLLRLAGEVFMSAWERKQSMEALQESEEKFILFMRHLTGLAYMLNDQLELVYVNETFEEVVGLNREACLGRRLNDVFSTEQAASIGRAARWAFDHGQPLEVYEDIEIDGGKRHFLSYKFPIPRTGKRPLLGVVSLDITRRKRAEAMLLGERQILEMLAVGKTLEEVLDAHVRSIEAQSHDWLCSILLLDADGRTLRNGAAPSLPDEYNDAIDGLQIGPDAGSCGSAAYHKKPVVVTDIAADSRWGDFRELALKYGLRACWSRPILSAANEVLGTFAVYYREAREPELQHQQIVEAACSLAAVAIERKRNEESRRQLETRMRQSQKLESLGILAGGIAHDFNNLLVGIMGNADLALQELYEHSPLFPCVKEIETAAHRASELSRQMLDYSGKGRFVVETFDLNEVVREMAHLLEVSISKKANLVMRLGADALCMTGDITQLRQIIMNLITNASEALEDQPGAITIRTGRRQCDRSFLKNSYLDEELPAGEYIYVEVKDSGVGMDRATRERIFDPFFTTKFTGRGLGLAAVLGIVRGHKGAIKVDSQTGRGARIRVFFPAVSAPIIEARIHIADEPPIAGSGLVLLVDDEEAVRNVGRRALEKWGFEVQCACDGVEAVEFFGRRGDEIRCVVLDLTMPNMDGEETFRVLREMRADVPVILSSGFNEHEVVERFYQQGLSAFLQKPYPLATLRDKILQVLQQPV